jgi:hypothetical protein
MANASVCIDPGGSNFVMLAALAAGAAMIAHRFRTVKAQIARNQFFPFPATFVVVLPSR